MLKVRIVQDHIKRLHISLLNVGLKHPMYAHIRISGMLITYNRVSGAPIG